MRVCVYIVFDMLSLKYQTEEYILYVLYNLLYLIVFCMYNNKYQIHGDIQGDSYLQNKMKYFAYFL